MNRLLILRVLSRVAMVEALLIFLSAMVGLLYGDTVLLPYGVPVLLLIIIAAILGRFKPRTNDFFAKEGFVCVALSWVFMSLFGTLPFYLSGAVPSFIDCLFETVSGFTTTGATILADVEAIPHGLLFWRSLTHWIGGMGVLVLLLAVTALAGDRSVHLMRAEAPGPAVGKLTPRLRRSSGILYGIYFAMTLLQIVLLLLGGMPLFDSVTTAFATTGTGGFGIKNAGIAAYQSTYIEAVIMAFMLLSGVNFTVYYLVITKRPREALKSEELRWFLGIFAVSTLLLTVNIVSQTGGALDALRLASFQSASIMSSTGFATANYNLWPEFSHVVLLLLMIIGACAGSTGGGFKISRIVILLKLIHQELSRMLHPRSVSRIKFDGKAVDRETAHGVLVYLAVFALIVTGGALLIAINGYDHVTTFTAVLAMLGNTGPGLSLVGPMDTFALFSPFSKGVLCLLMLIGRLEIFPVLMLCSPAVWKR